MRKMTRTEIIEILTQDNIVRDEIKALLEEYKITSLHYGEGRKNFTIKLSNLKSLAGVYLRDYFTHRRSESSYWCPVKTGVSKQRAVDAIEQPMIDWDVPLFESLPLTTYKLLMDSSEGRIEAERRSTLKFNTEAPTLKLDLFSYTLFENYLKSSKKITGKDAIRYLRLLPYPDVRKQVENDLHTKYLKLLWDNVKTKSLELSKNLGDMPYIEATHRERPFVTFESTDVGQEIPVGGWADSVRFPFSTITSIADRFNIPLRVHSKYITEAGVHDYITGVPKKNSMTVPDLVYAIDKIRVLTYLTLVDGKCPYYQLGLDQLMDELNKEDNITSIRESSLLQDEEKVVNALVRSGNLLQTLKV